MPFADGNLQDFWEDMPDDPKGARDVEIGRWMVSQILGLSRSLLDIHDCEITQDHSSMGQSEVKKKYGRHGDMKPANILWFRSSELDKPASDLGLLQITDLGLSDFKGSGAPQDSTAKGLTPEYRPPEVEENDQRVSQKSDIWAFGCILLEFLTWYLVGLSALQDFANARTRPSYQGMLDKAYFFLHAKGHTPIKATKHPAVTKVRNLKLPSTVSLLTSIHQAS